MKKTRIRVLVVDDSALMRKLIPQMLATDVIRSRSSARPWMETFCLKKIEELPPQRRHPGSWKCPA